MKILFIDPATNLGYAVGDTDNSLMFSGAESLKGQTMGEKVYELWELLNTLFSKYLATKNNVSEQMLIAWEEAAFSFKNPKQERMYGTWEGVLSLFCEQKKIPYMTVHNSTIKAYASKQGYFDRRKPKPRRYKEESLSQYKHRVTSWESDKHFDRKPRPRPGWNLTAISYIDKVVKPNDNEVDALWGLEYLISKCKNK